MAGFFLGGSFCFAVWIELKPSNKFEGVTGSYRETLYLYSVAYKGLSGDLPYTH